MNKIFQYSWRIFFIVIFIPTFYWQLAFESKSKKDAYLNGEVVEAKISSLYCRPGKSDYAIIEYMGNKYSVVWSCNRKKEGDVVKIKYSKKYDVVILEKYRYNEGLFQFLYGVCVFLHLAGIYSLYLYTYKSRYTTKTTYED